MSEEETERAHVNDPAVLSASSFPHLLNRETRHNLWCYKYTVVVVSAGLKWKVKEFTIKSTSNKESLAV